MTAERREYTRIECAAPSVLLFADGTEVPGVTRDASFGGAHMDCGHPSMVPTSADGDTGMACTLVLQVAGPAPFEAASITLRCHLMYLEDRRAGLRFTGASEADYARFRAFLLDHAEDRAGLLDEMEAYPNPAFSRAFGLPGFSQWLRRVLKGVQQRPGA